MGATLRAPDAAREAYRIPLDWVRTGQAYLVELEVVADVSGAPTARLGCSEDGWLEVSDDAGAHWYEVPASVQAGYELGPLLASVRKAISLRLTVPPGLPVRREVVELYLGLGT